MASSHHAHHTDYLSTSVSQSGNVSKITATFDASADSGWGGSTWVNGVGASINIGGHNHPRTINISGTSVHWCKTYNSFTHDSRGYHPSVTVTGHHDDTRTSTYGGANSVSTTVSLPRIPVPPSKVRSLSVSSIQWDSARVSWATPSDSGGKSIDSYHVHVATNSGFSGYRLAYSGSGHSTTVTGLSPHRKYWVRVIAHNSAGWNTSNPGYPTASFTSGAGASKPTVSKGTVAMGDSVTIYTNRKSSGFTHTLRYTWGSKSGTIATGVATQKTWAPPLSLADEIPDAVSAGMSIWCDTYDGATKVGTERAILTVGVPLSVVPSIGSVSAAEATSSPDVDSLVGGLVQGISTLHVAMSGQSGAHGSTIRDARITVDGQTVRDTSGTTAALRSSGTQHVVAHVTDSRGRTASKSITVSVLAYDRPKIDKASFSRANASGAKDEDGTQVRVDAVTHVSSLKPAASEKNTLTWELQTKPRGSGSWATQHTWTGSPPTLSTHEAAGSVLTTEARDARLVLSDLFFSTAAQGVISTGQVFMHWSTDGHGVGIGQYATKDENDLEVAGQIYQNNGQQVLDETTGIGNTGEDITTSTDWDALTSPGVYRIVNFNGNGAPSTGGTAGTLIVATQGTVGVLQIAVGSSSGHEQDFWQRTKYSTGGGWHPWMYAYGMAATPEDARAQLGFDTDDHDWTNATYKSGFTSQDAGQMAFCRRSGIVYMRGGAYKQSAFPQTTYVVCATAPSWARPSSGYARAGCAMSSGAAGMVQVHSSGDVAFSSGYGTHSFGEFEGTFGPIN